MVKDSRLREHEEGLLRPVLDEELLETGSGINWKRILFLASAIFMALLVVSYAWVGYGLDDIIVGLFVSENYEGSAVMINQTSRLVFLDGAYESLLGTYLGSQDKEFKACLLGSIDGGDYYASSVIIPRAISQSFAHVTSEPCPEGTIAEVHSHPYRKCIESRQDLLTKEMIHAEHPERVMAIMCEKGRFKFY